MKITIHDWIGAGHALMREPRQFDYVLSIGSTTPAPAGYKEFPADRRLRMRFGDSSVPSRRGSPKRRDIEQVITWFSTFPPDARVLIHCLAGESRSTACAYILACMNLGHGGELQALQHVVAVRPRAWPNQLIVWLGDQVLGREGAMVAAYKHHQGTEGWGSPRWGSPSW